MRRTRGTIRTIAVAMVTLSAVVAMTAAHALSAQGAPSAATTARAPSYPDGCVPLGRKEPRIIGCILSRETAVFGRPMPAGTWLHYDSTGAYTYFEFRKPGVYDGWKLAGGGDGPHHMVYPDGTPRGLWFDEAQEVQGVPCRAFSFLTEVLHGVSVVRFHRNGKLAECKLSRNATIQGVAFGKGALVQLDSIGTVIRAKH